MFGVGDGYLGAEKGVKWFFFPFSDIRFLFSVVVSRRRSQNCLDPFRPKLPPKIGLLKILGVEIINELWPDI